MHSGPVKGVGGMISGTAGLEKMISGVILTCNKCSTRYEVLDIPRPRTFAKCQSCEKEVLEIIESESKLINATRSGLQEIESLNGLDDIGQCYLFLLIRFLI